LKKAKKTSVRNGDFKAEGTSFGAGIFSVSFFFVLMIPIKSPGPTDEQTDKERQKLFSLI